MIYLFLSIFNSIFNLNIKINLKHIFNIEYIHMYTTEYEYRCDIYCLYIVVKDINKIINLFERLCIELSKKLKK